MVRLKKLSSQPPRIPISHQSFALSILHRHPGFALAFCIGRVISLKTSGLNTDTTFHIEIAVYAQIAWERGDGSLSNVFEFEVFLW